MEGHLACYPPPCPPLPPMASVSATSWPICALTSNFPGAHTRDQGAVTANHPQDHPRPPASPAGRYQGAVFFLARPGSNGSRRFWRNGAVDAIPCAVAAGAGPCGLCRVAATCCDVPSASLGRAGDQLGARSPFADGGCPIKTIPLARVRTRLHVRFITHAQQRG